MIAYGQRPGLHAPPDALPALGVTGPNARAEAEGRVVAELDGVLLLGVRMTAAAGPNVSCRKTGMSGRTSAVGA